jgi:hypothetical protein
VLASYRLLRTHAVASVTSILIAFVVSVAFLDAGVMAAWNAPARLVVAEVPRHLVVQFSAQSAHIRTGSKAIFFAKIAGPGRLRATSLSFGDGTRPAGNSGQVSCAAGGGMQIVETLSYQHRYLRPGTYRATLVVKTQALGAPCKETTTTRVVTVDVFAR